MSTSIVFGSAWRIRDPVSVAFLIFFDKLLLHKSINTGVCYCFSCRSRFQKLRIEWITQKSTISYCTTSYEVTIGSVGYHCLFISLQSKNQHRQRPPFVNTVAYHKISLTTFYSIVQYQDSIARVA